VLGVLVEKERTVSDTYPLSLNSLTSGCNQKSNRDPLIEATEAEVQAAVDALKARTLVIESSGARVARYSHNVGRVLRVPRPGRGAAGCADVARRPDRRRASHRHRAAASVCRHLLGRCFLDELAARAPEQGGPLVKRLTRPIRRARGALDALPVRDSDRRQRVIGRGAGNGDVSVSEIAALRAHVEGWRARWLSCVPASRSWRASSAFSG